MWGKASSDQAYWTKSLLTLKIRLNCCKVCCSGFQVRCCGVGSDHESRSIHHSLPNALQTVMLTPMNSDLDRNLQMVI